MPKSKLSGKLVAKLRKTIGISQTQFAAMVGVSKHTIISAENGRNQLSTKLAKRIRAATGAEILDDSLSFEPYGGNPRIVNGERLPPEILNFTRQRWDGTGKNDKTYTREDFEQWRRNFYSCNDKTAREQFQTIKVWVEYVFRAATRSGRAGKRDRFPAIYQSLVDWLNETRELFSLQDEIEQILENETHVEGEACLSIQHLLEDQEEAKKTLAEFGYDYSKVKKIFKKRKTNFYNLIIVTESRLVWDPLNGNTTVPCSNWKVTKPKFWLEDWRHFHKRLSGEDWKFGYGFDEQLKDRLPPVDSERIY